MTRSLEVLISVTIVFPLFLFILFFPLVIGGFPLFLFVLFFPIVAGGSAITRGVPLFLFVLVLDRVECFVLHIAVITRSGFFRINFAVLFSDSVVGQYQWAGTQAKGNANDTELFEKFLGHQDRKSTRLNSSHVRISYAVFCLKKKNKDVSGAVDNFLQRDGQSEEFTGTCRYGDQRDALSERYQLDQKDTIILDHDDGIPYYDA